MRIGLSGGAASADKMIDQAVRAEAEGFHALWYASAVGGDPLVAMALAGRATTRIELGTSVLQTFTCHPVLQASRVASVVEAMARPGFTLGIGPSHEPVIAGAYGMDNSHAGRNTDEYVQIVTALLRGEAVDFKGEDLTLRGGMRIAKPAHDVPVLVAALAPRLLRVAGAVADGTILWMGNARSIERHVHPLLSTAATDAGRPAPRIVAGLPVAVHDDVAEGRSTAATQFAGYGVLPNYRRILDHGGAAGPGDAAIVGNEASVAAQLQALLDAGATDLWAAIFPVGDDKAGSRNRTRALLASLV